MRRRFFAALQKRTSYQQRIKNLLGSSLVAYWPLDELSGTVARDVSGNGRDGTYANVTLGNEGIGDGKTAASFNGSSSKIAIATTPFKAAFNGLEGYCFVWFMTPSAVQIDGVNRVMIQLQADSNNLLQIKKANSNHTYVVQYKSGGANKQVTIDASEWSVNPVLVGVAWSKSGDYVRFYYQGKKVGADLTGVGEWAGVLDANNTFLGTNYAGSPNTWSGRLAEIIIGNVPITDAQVSNLYTSVKNPFRFSVIGDSIEQYPTVGGWNNFFVDQYNNGFVWQTNHAVAGNSITSHIATQVAAAAADSANLIILALGTNDDNAGDMAALQAKVEAGLAALKISNPNSRIFYMNVLPRWTDTGGGTVVDKSNIRTAIAAACTAQSVTCWDTFSTPWITAAQTIEGLHPTAEGHEAITAQVLARL